MLPSPCSRWVCRRRNQQASDRRRPAGRTVKEKVCSRCQQRKPAEDFHLYLHSCDGRQAYCKACVRSYGRETKARRAMQDGDP